MARKATKKTREASTGINETSLTKGELRKLDALRKSLGTAIADRAFSQWLRQRQSWMGSGSASTLFRIVAPVVVKPDVASKTASVTLAK